VLRWLRDDAFEVDGNTFQITLGPEGLDLTSRRLGEREFLIRKSRGLVEQYEELVAELEPKSIVELGILYGGSTVLLTTLAQPAKYVALDLHDRSTPAFASWLMRGSVKDRVRVFYGVDQADTERLTAILRAEFGGGGLDLVIDDASHSLAPTRMAFNALFPHLRAGGIYVIEDWETQHLVDRRLRDDLCSDPKGRARFAEQLHHAPESWLKLREPLTRLVFEIVLAQAYTDIVDEVRIRHGAVLVRRGPDEIGRDGFDISDHYLDLGRALLGGPA
jgi:cephalosporin hydroxylase